MTSPLDFTLDTCVAYINVCTKENPQVEPLILQEFANSIIAMSKAVLWYTTKPLVGDASIITDPDRTAINSLVNDFNMPEYAESNLDVIASINDFVMPEDAESNLDVIDYINRFTNFNNRTKAMLKICDKTFLLNEAEAGKSIRKLLRCMFKLMVVIRSYEERVDNKMAYFLFFGYSMFTIHISTRAMLRATTLMEN